MLFEPLFAHSAARPNEPAFFDDFGKYTYAELAAMAAGLGMYLSAQTAKPHVGVLLPASAGFVASFYGTLLAGKSVVPINFLMGDREIAHVIADSGIDTVITIPLLAPKLKDSELKIIDLSSLPKPPPGAIAPKFPSPRSTDLAVVLYTSGTSGLPKGVMLTYGNLQSDVESAISHAQLTGQHKFLGILPLFHSTGMLATMLAPVHLGSETVYIARFSPVGTVKAIREHKISVMAAVPSMYGAMARLKDAGPDDVKSIYAALSGGEPLPATVRDAFEKKFNKPIFEGYGLTETIGPVTFNTPQAHKPGSVGMPIPGVNVRITDDDARDVPQGRSGEIWLKGPMIMDGYFNKPDDTAAAITADGYFKTGDLGMIDDEGYLHVTGRKKELIIVAGEKASPREIEEVLARYPAVTDVAVIGRKDESRGEVVVAFVVAREGQTIKENELREFARSAGLVNWKVPKEIHVVRDLPRSPTGKVLKRVLAEQLAQQASSSSSK